MGRKDEFEKKQQVAVEFVASLVIALKNYGLYSPGHEVRTKSILAVKSRLESFLNEWGTLRIDIQRDSLIFKGVEIQKKLSASELNLSAILFRDGIRWISFHEEITLKELDGFVSIVSQYRIPQEDARGDIVTSLWAAAYPHFKYVAEDVLWKAETMVDFSGFKVSGNFEFNDADLGSDQDEARFGIMGDLNSKDHSGYGPGLQLDEEESGDYEDKENSELGVDAALHGRSISNYRTMYKLMPDEKATLAAMVAKEEKSGGRDTVMDVLLIILEAQNDPDNFEAILEFVKEEFQDTLESGEFYYAYDFLVSLRRFYPTCRDEKAWALPLINSFFKEISGPDVLESLGLVWPGLSPMDKKRIELIKKVLLLLLPNSVEALAPMIPRINAPHVRKLLTETVAIMAGRDNRIIIPMLKSHDESLVQILVGILGDLGDESLMPVLLDMTRHSAERVRREALKALIKQDRPISEKLFHLMDDNSDTIKSMMVGALARKKSEVAESYLVDYLRQKQFKLSDRKHIIRLYKTLGMCGSSKSTDFLKEILLHRVFSLNPLRWIHRQGAAIALSLIDDDKAWSILEKASKSFFPNIRSACRRAAGVTNDQ